MSIHFELITKHHINGIKPRKTINDFQQILFIKDLKIKKNKTFKFGSDFITRLV